MNRNIWRIQEQPLYILNRRPYRETSLLIDGLTRDHGKVALIAKGARGAKSRRASMLQSFSLLTASWQGRSELLTLTQCEQATESLPALKGKRLYCGFYLNEIIVYLLHAYDPYPRLFEAYRQTLAKLSDDDHDVSQVLRQFECTLMQDIGYQLILDHDVQTGLPIEATLQYGYLPGAGPSVAFRQNPAAFCIEGRGLMALQSGVVADVNQSRLVKRLMRFLIDHLLDGKIIKSRSLFT